MLRRFHTAVLEKNETYSAPFETEPYECGWASEAIFFIRVLEMNGAGGKLRAHAQVSPDGLFWCGMPDAPIQITGKGQHYLALRGFGGWLRLRVDMEGRDVSVKLMIYLALKE